MKERVALTLELALGADGALPTEIRAFTPGLNRTLKGDLHYTPRSQKDVATFAADIGRELPIDYEHASLEAERAADPKKAGEAAGWFNVDARDDGLYFTDISWTDDAAGLMKARKYRFFSPVVFRDPKTREITGVLNAALTNNPATKGQMPLVASATTKEQTVKIAALLKLAADANEETIAAAVEKVRDERELLLTATGKATVGEASAAIATWKKDAEQVATLSTRVAELEGAQKKGEVATLIKAAQAEGKVSPAQVSLLEKMGARSVDELKEFLSASPVITAVKTPAQEPKSGASAVVLSAEDKEVAKMLGISAEDLAKSKQAVGPVIPVVDITQKPTA